MPVKSAIQNKSLLGFTYDGFARVVEPHTYGVDSKGHGGEYIGWKMFHTSEMRQVSVLPEHFIDPRPKYKRGDSAFSTIHAQL
jgi:hypothetical protein